MRQRIETENKVKFREIILREIGDFLLAESMGSGMTSSRSLDG